MRRSAALPALLRTKKLWREHPTAPARADHVVQAGEPLLVPLVRLRDAGDLVEIPDNSGRPLSALTRAIREVCGHQPGLH